MLKFKFILCGITALLVSNFLVAQGTFKYVHTQNVPVSKQAEFLKLAWAGGMNHPQFSVLDVDFDCADDLVIFDRENNSIKVFINDSIAGVASYHYDPSYEKYFPDTLTNFLMIRDYNNDGKGDLISGGIGGVRVHKNVSDSTLKFELFTNLLPCTAFGGPSNVYVSSIDLPVFDDVNADGLIDVISPSVTGGVFRFYKNVSTDPEEFKLDMQDNCWGDIQEGGNDSVILGAGCKRSPNGGQRHSGSAILTLDLFNNGLKDLLLGDNSYDNLIRLENGGSLNADKMISVDYHYAGNGSKEVQLMNFVAAFYVDVNNNGKKDLLVAPNQVAGSEDTGNVWFYDNFGLNSLPNFEHTQDDFLVGDQVDVGTMAFPVLVDISGDGLDDLIIGNMGYFEDYDDVNFITSYKSMFAYYKNVGTASAPAFEWVTDDYENLSQKDFIRMVPTFGDLDADGDLDMLIGEVNGSISYYDNVAGPNNPADFQLVADTFMGQLFGTQISPLLYDIDKDNALDLIVGQQNGHMTLYLNMGDSTNPVYTLTKTDTLGGIFRDYSYYFQRNVNPFIGKIDGGQDVLVVADGAGDLTFYDGLDSNPYGTYNQLDSFRINNGKVAVTGANLFGGDSLQLIVGEETGGIRFMELDATIYSYEPYPRDTCASIQDTDIIGMEELLSAGNVIVAPNPSNGDFKVHFEALESGIMEIQLLDLTGKLVYANSMVIATGENFISVNQNGLKPGIYVIQIQLNDKISYSKVIIQ